MSIDLLQTNPPLTPDEAKQYSPLSLAFLGDSVYEVMVREALLREANRSAKQLHEQAVAHVRAAFQASAVEQIIPLLSQDEADILRRGRNANGISVPKSSTPADYRKATGFECLFGYLFLCGQNERLHTLFTVIWEKSCNHEKTE